MQLEMQRVLVVGCSGSGKTTTARALAVKLGLPRIELDALFHGPNWERRPTFAEDVDRATREPAWVIDGNYAAVRELLWSRIDTVVWLDLPRWLTEYQVVRRSFVRWALREELWNGNREPSPLGWLNPEHPVRWSWNKYPEYGQIYGARFVDPAHAHIAKHRLRSRREVAELLRRVGLGR